MGRLKSGINTFVKLQLKQHGQLVKRHINNQNMELLFKLRNCKQAAETELDKLDKRLLSLHGHPNNIKLLQDLEEEVIEATARHSIAWETILNFYKVPFELQYFSKHLQTQQQDFVFNFPENVFFFFFSGEFT